MCTATPAHAFEKQWHLGGGLGGAVANGHSAGPALSLYGAYGISDVFDVRLEALGSHHDALGDASLFYAGKLALAYKVDVIEWIPYAGVGAGFLGVTSPGASFRSFQPTVGGIAGLDYAVSREFGMGLAVLADYGFRARATYGALFLRAEYRFGW